MGKRKSRAKPAPKKRMDKLDSVFCCPFCNHGSGVECKIDLKNNIGEASYRICQESFSTTVNALTEPIDITELSWPLNLQIGPNVDSHFGDARALYKHTVSGLTNVKG